ncbi:MAG: IS3 family transposase [Gemmatimonadaceae bacterium]|nr:IS3 family transposase [Gemmatimonadaceae bacterium]
MGSKRSRRERRAFSAEFKAEAVRMMHERRATGVPLAQIARELAVRPEQLHTWAKQPPRAGAGGATHESLEEENRRLRRELATLQQEQGVPKKSSGVLRERVAMRCAVIARHRGEFPVRLMCRVLDVSVAGFYAYLKRPETWRAVIDDVLMAHITVAFEASGGTYGAPRIHKELQAEGLPTSCKRVARLMREHQLVARPRATRRVITTDSTHAEPIAPNRLRRAFDIHGIALNQIWVGDITYIPTREGFLYLATVLDLASRRCVGWAMRDTLAGDLVCSALHMAYTARQPAPGLIFHSDRGSQYAAQAYRTQLASCGMRASMSRQGDCFDNAVAESFFSTLEFELLMHHDFHSRAEARRAIFRFIETWYNPKRRHSTLGYVSPTEYEAQQHRMAA